MFYIPSDWNSPQPFLIFVFGIFLCCFAAIGAYAGKLWVRFRWICRAKELKWFWFEVALYFLCGLGFIGYYFYLVGLSAVF
jgi:hypothetical protein